MPIVSFVTDDLFRDLPAPVPVKAPMGAPVSETRSRALPGQGGSRVGVWECTPGVWRRQIVQAEMCVILSGKAVFEPDEGEPVAVEAGTTHYFPPNSLGVWRILETTRKIFITFDEA